MNGDSELRERIDSFKTSCKSQEAVVLSDLLLAVNDALTTRVAELERRTCKRCEGTGKSTNKSARPGRIDEIDCPDCTPSPDPSLAGELAEAVKEWKRQRHYEAQPGYYGPNPYPVGDPARLKLAEKLADAFIADAARSAPAVATYDRATCEAIAKYLRINFWTSEKTCKTILTLAGQPIPAPAAKEGT